MQSQITAAVTKAAIVLPHAKDILTKNGVRQDY